MSESKAVLLEAAAGEFAKNGPKGTRIQDIVAAAGVNERMIYHHFGSKDGLYRAVIEDQRTRLGTTWAPLLDRALTMEPYEGMRLALHGFVDALNAAPQAAALLIHEALGDTPLAIPGQSQELPKPIRDLYERGQAEGVFTASVPFEVAYAVVVSSLLAMTAFGLRRFTEFVLAWPESEPGEFRDQVVTQVLNGMTG
jgi:AcrR family transcriptional regulator